MAETKSSTSLAALARLSGRDDPRVLLAECGVRVESGKVNGRRNEKREPLTLESTLSWPPTCSTMRATTASPSPAQTVSTVNPGRVEERRTKAERLISKLGRWLIVLHLLELAEYLFEFVVGYAAASIRDDDLNGDLSSGSGILSISQPIGLLEWFAFDHNATAFREFDYMGVITISTQKWKPEELTSVGSKVGDDRSDFARITNDVLGAFGGYDLEHQPLSSGVVLIRSDGFIDESREVERIIERSRLA